MNDEKKPFLDHLGELRKRIILCIIAVVIGLIASYLCYDLFILDVVRAPIDMLNGEVKGPFTVFNPLQRLLESFRQRMENPEFKLHYIGPLEGFTVKLKLSLYCGILIAFPFILFQLWKFVSVGLKDKERKLIVLYFPIAIVLFLVGVLFAYFITIPAGLLFLVNVSSELEPMIIISKYTSIVILLGLVFGVIFEMPLIILFLTKIGIVTPKFLAKKRKYAFFLVFVIAAVLTPPDIFTQILLAIPVILLYELSVLISRLAWKKPEE